MRFSDLNLLSVGHTVQMAAAVFTGEGKAFIAWFPGSKEELPFDHLEMSLDEWTAFMRQTDTLEVECVVKNNDGGVGKAVLRKSQRSIDQHVSWKVYRRDQYRCRYCGKDDVPLTVDHIITWESGGPSEEINLLSCCKKCNKARGNTSYEEWLKHPHYMRVSTKLDPATKAANEAVLGRLSFIPIKLHVRSR